LLLAISTTYNQTPQLNHNSNHYSKGGEQIIYHSRNINDSERADMMIPANEVEGWSYGNHKHDERLHPAAKRERSYRTIVPRVYPAPASAPKARSANNTPTTPEAFRSLSSCSLERDWQSEAPKALINSPVEGKEGSLWLSSVRSRLEFAVQ